MRREMVIPHAAFLYAPAEAARLLRISRAKLYRLLDEAKIQSVRIGRCRRIPADELRRVSAEGVS